MIANVLDTQMTRIISTQSNFNELTKFINNNRSEIVIKDNLSQLLKSDKISMSPTMKLYTEFRDLLLDKNNIITLLNIQDSISVPQLLNINSIDLDTKTLKASYRSVYNVLSTYPEFTDKILINVSNNYNQQKNSFKSLFEFASKFVRDVISRSYTDTIKSNWLPLDILTILVDIYSWCISYNIVRLYNLNYNDQRVIAIILAMYFTQKCYANNDGKLVPIYRRIRRLGTTTEISAVEIKVLDYLGEKEFTLEDAVEAIKVLSPEHVSDFSIQIFIRLGRAYYVDNIFSIVSLEYPPYWLYSILTAVAGENKSNMYWSLQKTGLLKDARNLVKLLERSIVFDAVFNKK